MIKVSRKSLFEKLFETTEAEIRAKFKGDDVATMLAMLPTDEEREWVRIFQSTAPELQRLQRQMSICVDVEVQEYDETFFSFIYAGKLFRVEAPKNSYSVAKALSKSVFDAFEVMCQQGCVTVDSVILDAKKNTLGVDELSLTIKTTDKFFFQHYAG